MKTAEVNNVLVDQKDSILHRIAVAGSWEELKAVDNLMQFVEPLWGALEYGYKTKEIHQKIIDKAEELVGIEEEYLAQARRNCRTRGTTETEIRRLKDLIASLK